MMTIVAKCEWHGFWQQFVDQKHKQNTVESWKTHQNIHFLTDESRQQTQLNNGGKLACSTDCLCPFDAPALSACWFIAFVGHGGKNTICSIRCGMQPIKNDRCHLQLHCQTSPNKFDGIELWQLRRQECHRNAMIFQEPIFNAFILSFVMDCHIVECKLPKSMWVNCKRQWRGLSINSTEANDGLHIAKDTIYHEFWCLTSQHISMSFLTRRSIWKLLIDKLEFFWVRLPHNINTFQSLLNVLWLELVFWDQIRLAEGSLDCESLQKEPTNCCFKWSCACDAHESVDAILMHSEGILSSDSDKIC